MRRKKLGDRKKRIWFLDQYHNPHETKFPVRHVRDWFSRCGIEYVNAVPQINPRVGGAGSCGLFSAQPVGRPLDHVIAQLSWIFTQGREGGFFIMIGRKSRTELDGVARAAELFL